MPEYRQNPLTGQWVIISPERGHRPRTREATPAQPASPERDERCPFCPGNERRTPPEVFALRDDYATVDREGWRVRVVPNKYAAVCMDAEGVPTPESIAVKTEPAAAPLSESALRVSRPAVGMHEVIVECPAHRRRFADHGPEQAEHIVRTLRHRCAMIMQARDVKYVSVFKNEGRLSGSTIEHPHFQIIAPAVIPPTVKSMVEREAAYAERNGRPLMEALLEDELDSGQRVIAANDAFVVLSPWASAQPYETWIVPRAQTAFFNEVPDGLIEQFAALVRDTLRRVDRVLDRPDYNLVIHNGPKWHKSQSHHCWFAQVSPRTALPAGYELATNMFINSTTPEEAAVALRNV